MKKKYFYLIFVFIFAQKMVAQNQWYVGTNIGNTVVRPLITDFRGGYFAAEIRRFSDNSKFVPFATIGYDNYSFRLDTPNDKQISAYSSKGTFVSVGADLLAGNGTLEENKKKFSIGAGLTYSYATDLVTYKFLGTVFPSYERQQLKYINAVALDVRLGYWLKNERFLGYLGIKNSVVNAWFNKPTSDIQSPVKYVAGVGQNILRDDSARGTSILTDIVTFELKVFYKLNK